MLRLNDRPNNLRLIYEDPATVVPLERINVPRASVDGQSKMLGPTFVVAVQQEEEGDLHTTSDEPGFGVIAEPIFDRVAVTL